MGLFDWFKKDKKNNNVEEIKEENITAESVEQEDNTVAQENAEAENNNFNEENQNNEVEEKALTESEEKQEENNNTLEEKAESLEISTEEEKPVFEAEKEEISKEEINISEEKDNTEIEEAEIESESKEEEQIQEDSENNIEENTETNEEKALEEPEAEAQEVAEVQAEEKPKGFFAKIKSGLAKTRDNIMSGVEQVLKSFTTIDEEFYEELEEALIMADLGVETSVNIIEKVRECVKKEKIHEVEKVKEVIVRVITEMLEEGNEELQLPSPSVILVIGVNGVGKTTTIGKLTNNYKKEGKNVLLAAADTFRAAAIDQLEIWGERNDVTVIKHQENSDPAAVVFDAVQAAKARKSDILICDTAGRLHNKKNLMEELRKIAKVVDREYPQAHTEVFLVLDATTGQNALQQAKLFKEVADITGIVLTKLDGTAKGGIVIAIKNELNIPVRYIGVGEGIDDLQPFNANDFAKALFANEE